MMVPKIPARAPAQGGWASTFALAVREFGWQAGELMGLHSLLCACHELTGKLHKSVAILKQSWRFVIQCGNYDRSKSNMRDQHICALLSTQTLLSRQPIANKICQCISLVYKMSMLFLLFSVTRCHTLRTEPTSMASSSCHRMGLSMAKARDSKAVSHQMCHIHRNCFI